MPKATLDEIKKYKKLYEDLYSNVRKEQNTDLTYIKDTFAVPQVRDPHKVYRAGFGNRIVNASAEQLLTSNPQALVESVEETKGAIAGAKRLTTEVNRWFQIMKRASPNPFTEYTKNLIARGESYIDPIHNELWVTKELGKDMRGYPIFDKSGLPVLFVIPEPMVIYGSPEEDIDGCPIRVVIFYERQPYDVIATYPHWSNPKKGKRGERKVVEWFGYIDKDTRYFEADGEAILKGGIQPNLYKMVTGVRKYSGFGKRSPSGELADLIVSDIRYGRDLLHEECVTRSNIRSIEQLFAHRGKTVQAQGEINEEQFKEVQWGAYTVKIFKNLKGEATIGNDDVPEVPQHMYQSYIAILNQIHERYPFTMAGFPMGTSGRHEDIAATAGMRKYATVVDNTEIAFATAVEKAFHIMRTIPGLIPGTIKESDLDYEYKVTVRLRAKDPIEEDRLITLGDRLRRLPNPAIDLETFHTEFLGYTQDKSKKVMAKMLADMVTIYNPSWAEVAGMVAAEESGTELYLEKLTQQRQQMGKGLAQPPPATTQERALGETETELGMELGTEGTRGARIPPERYMRGE